MDLTKSRIPKLPSQIPNPKFPKSAVTASTMSRPILKSRQNVGERSYIPPGRTNLSRRRSASTSALENRSTVRAPKRAADNTSVAGPNKKLLKPAPAAKTLASKPGTAGKAGGKLPPWDLRGRLALAEENLKDKAREIDEIKYKIENATVIEEAHKNEIAEQEIKHNDQMAALRKNFDEEIARMTAELEAAAATHNREIANLKDTHLHELERMRDRHQKEIFELKEKLNTAKANYIREYAELEERLRTEMAVSDGLRNRIHTDLKEIARLRAVIEDLKGKIRVLCRVRPLLSTEPDTYEISYMDDKTLKVSSGAKGKVPPSPFEFNRVFAEGSTQSEIYQELEGLIVSAMDGYRACIFAYGQTGSGKTYTMQGKDNEDEEGVIGRAVRTIFNTIEDRKDVGWSYEIEVSCLQVYMEKIEDLLDPDCPLPHDIRMKPNGREDDIYVTNIQVEKVDSAEHLHDILSVAYNNRIVASTAANDVSSRSHSVVQITITGKNELRKEESFGVLNLVDLAGSEKFDDRNSSARTDEMIKINKSLSQLKTVIIELANKKSHISFRGSKLTHLLSPSLSGNSKALMIVNLSPAAPSFPESVNALRFATVVNSCDVSARCHVKKTT